MIKYVPHPADFTSREDAKEFIETLLNKYHTMTLWDEKEDRCEYSFSVKLFDEDQQALVKRDIDNFLLYCEKELLEHPKVILNEVSEEHWDKHEKEIEKRNNEQD